MDASFEKGAPMDDFLLSVTSEKWCVGTEWHSGAISLEFRGGFFSASYFVAAYYGAELLHQYR